VRAGTRAGLKKRITQMCIRGAVIFFIAMKGRAEILSMRNYLDPLEFAQSLDGAPSGGEPANIP